MEAIDLLLQMAYRSGARVLVACCGSLLWRDCLARFPASPNSAPKKPVRVVHWLCGEDINISARLSLPIGMVMYIISFPTIETQLPLG